MVEGAGTVVIVSHNMNTVSSLCDRIVHMHQGQSSTTEALKDAIAMYEGMLSEGGMKFHEAQGTGLVQSTTHEAFRNASFGTCWKHGVST